MREFNRQRFSLVNFYVKSNEKSGILEKNLAQQPPNSGAIPSGYLISSEHLVHLHLSHPSILSGPLLATNITGSSRKSVERGLDF